jgi:hypothetical protein
MFDAVWTQDMTQNYTEAVTMAREADAETTSMYYQRDAASNFEA